METITPKILTRSDEEQMQHVAERNTASFKALYKRYELAIFNLILKYTGDKSLAQDLLQETFTRIWFAAHSFNQEKGRFKTWLFTIALNITKSEMSKKQYSYFYQEISEKDFTEADMEETDEKIPDARMVNIEIQKHVRFALSKLEPFMREVIILRHYQQLKFSEIAQITNTPEGTLKSRFHRAILLLKEHLTGMDKSYAASK
ncbi:MAG: sigma-70 family RNA polymerase sigma factor [Methanosarcina sp.]|nr:sigma-70 family RNA polymerase sigma factor [Methanosarcina sp.]